MTLDVGGGVLNVDPVASDHVPQVEQAVDRGIPAEEVAVGDWDADAADATLGPAAVVGAHGVAEDVGREVGLASEWRLDSHCAQVGLADAGCWSPLDPPSSFWSP